MHANPRSAGTHDNARSGCCTNPTGHDCGLDYSSGSGTCEGLPGEAGCILEGIYGYGILPLLDALYPDLPQCYIMT